MQTLPRQSGWIEVVCGPMFSGKTEELIRRLRRVVYARQKVVIFKPAIDNRYAEVEIVSHSKQRLVAIPVDEPEEILERIEDDVEVVGIDEAQFMGHGLLRVVQQLADQGLRVVVAGLDLDYRGVPFDPMPELMAVAEFVTKIHAICTVCGDPASRSQRLVSQQDRVVLGSEESYEPRCRKHHTVDERDLPEQSRLPL